MNDQVTPPERMGEQDGPGWPATMLKLGFAALFAAALIKRIAG